METYTMPAETPSSGCSPRGRSLIAGYFTLIVSGFVCGVTLIALLGAYSTVESTGTLILMLSVMISYASASLLLISGVKEEKVEKFVCWIMISVLSVGVSVYQIIILIIHLNEFEEYIYDDLGRLAYHIFFIGMLIFGLWSVICLWRSYGNNSAQVEGDVQSEGIQV